MRLQAITVRCLCLILGLSAGAYAVTLKEISITQSAKAQVTVSFEASGILNCTDKVLANPDRILLDIVNVKTPIKLGIYNVNRGGISSITITQKSDNHLEVSLVLTESPRYTLITTDYLMELNLPLADEQSVEPWSTSKELYLYTLQDKYSFRDTLFVSWRFIGARDTIRYHYKIDGPKEWQGDSIIQQGIWTPWKKGMNDSFKNAAFPVKGSYKITVQYGSPDEVLGEESMKFKIKP